PEADYPVRVYAEPSQHDPPEDELYAGVYKAALNTLVSVVFVPDVSAVAPPWDTRRLSSESEYLVSAEEARLVAALLARYVVTPNADRAGRDEPFEWDPGDEDGPRGGVVVYATPAGLGRYAWAVGAWPVVKVSRVTS